MKPRGSRWFVELLLERMSGVEKWTRSHELTSWSAAARLVGRFVEQGYRARVVTVEPDGTELR